MTWTDDEYIFIAASPLFSGQKTTFLKMKENQIEYATFSFPKKRNNTQYSLVTNVHKIREKIYCRFRLLGNIVSSVEVRFGHVLRYYNLRAEQPNKNP